MYTCREIHLLDRYSVSYSWYNIYFSLVLVNLIMKSKWKQVCFLSFVYYVLLLGVQLSKGEGWNPVIKRGGLGSSHQKGRVGIQLSKGQGWDPINPPYFHMPVPKWVHLRWEVIVCFGDIVGIGDHQCTFFS